MDALGIVVVNIQSNGFVQLVEIVVMFERAKFQLETAEETFHETVLPWASSFAARQCYFQFVAQQLVLVAQVLTALVAVQDRRWRVFTEGVKQGGERQLAGVAQPQPPAHDLPCLEIEDYCKVVPLALEPQVGKILYPGTRVRHASVAVAILRTALVAEGSELVESIGRGRYLGWRRSSVLRFLTWPGNDNAGLVADSPCLMLTPLQVQR